MLICWYLYKKKFTISNNIPRIIVMINLPIQYSEKRKKEDNKTDYWNFRHCGNLQLSVAGHKTQVVKSDGLAQLTATVYLNNTGVPLDILLLLSKEIRVALDYTLLIALIKGSLSQLTTHLKYIYIILNRENVLAAKENPTDCFVISLRNLGIEKQLKFTVSHSNSMIT